MSLGILSRHEDTVRILHHGSQQSVGSPIPISSIGQYSDPLLIGAGGMGLVYKATAEDGRAVAVKVIPVGATERDLAGRLGREWSTLSALDHPNIARVFDSGLTEDGRPYFAMEYIPGAPIVQFADEHQLTIRERLELFLGVVDAVAYLHRQGIIHRDLKPGNILVMSSELGTAIPKVIDFGLAKLIGETAGATTAGGFLGTPYYMAPEQVSGANVQADTRADVYALGVILYELLIGSVPLSEPGDQETSVLELLLRLQLRDPAPPSSRLKDDLTPTAILRRTDAAGLRAALTNDLDRVVLKALHRSREERYGTVEALAADVRRYMANETVSVGYPSTFSQFCRFVRRNKTLVGIAGAAFMALIGVASGTTYGLIRARSAERLATERLQEVEETRVSLSIAKSETEKTLRESESARRNAELQLSEMKDEAVRVGDPREMMRLDKLKSIPEVNEALKALAKACDHPDLPASIRWSLQRVVADNLWKLGELKSALPIMERVYNARRAELGDEDIRVRNSGLALADLFAISERQTDAVRLYERHLPPLGPVDVIEPIGRLVSRTNLAIGYEKLNKPDRAIALYRAILERGVPVYGADHPTIASVALALAIQLATREREEAIHLADAIKSIVGTRQLSFHGNPAHALYCLGWVYRYAGRPNLAEQYYERSANQWLIERPSCWQAHNTRGEYADVLLQQGKYEAAAEQAIMALVALEAVPSYFDVDWQRCLREAHSRVIDLYLEWGKIDDALDWSMRPQPDYREKAPKPRLAVADPAP